MVRILHRMGSVARFRERLVLAHVRDQLDPGEDVLAWSHASVPDSRSPALFVVTRERCLLSITSPSVDDVEAPLGRLHMFDLDRSSSAIAQVRVHGDGREVLCEFSLTSRARSRAMGRVLAELARADVGAPEGYDPNLTSPLQPMPRGVKDHARRVWVTVLGVLVLAVSVVFASPFVPGPGALTAVAGFAILAKEYEWARDVHVWSARQAERFMAWFKRRRHRMFPGRGASAAADAGRGAGRRPGTVDAARNPAAMDADPPTAGAEPGSRRDAERGSSGSAAAG